MNVSVRETESYGGKAIKYSKEIAAELGDFSPVDTFTTPVYVYSISAKVFDAQSDCQIDKTSV